MYQTQQYIIATLLLCYSIQKTAENYPTTHTDRHQHEAQTVYIPIFITKYILNHKADHILLCHHKKEFISHLNS